MARRSRFKYRGYFVGNRFRKPRGRSKFYSINPSKPSEVILAAVEDLSLVADAFRGAAKAFNEWAGRTLVQRQKVLVKFRTALRRSQSELIEAIQLETGKSEEDSRAEVKVTISKFDVTFARAREYLSEKKISVGKSVTGRVTHQPIGVMFIPGPFNFPLHIPNGHWVPALLAGNTVVFKPSEVTPLVGQIVAECARESGLPAGVFQVIQGGRKVAQAALQQPELGGVLFTGSYETGVRIREALAARTNVMLALEMGGNNPVVVCPDADMLAAAREIHAGVTLTSGQRCTAPRRLIVIGKAWDKLMPELQSLFESSIVPPLATKLSYEAYHHVRIEAGRHGLEVLAEGAIPGEVNGFYAAPVVLKNTRNHRRLDLLRKEWFMPVLFAEHVRTLKEAISAANDTKYGLAAAVFTARRKTYEHFRAAIQAGIVNWNRSTVGASGRLPFGGVGHSGNFRPAGISSIEYCVRPVSSLEKVRS